MVRKFLIYCLDEEDRVTDARIFNGDYEAARATAEAGLPRCHRVELWEAAICLYRAGQPQKTR